MNGRLKPKHPEHIHTPDDGRGPRDVFCDGKLIERAFFADTQAGVVKAFVYPFVFLPGRKDVQRYTLRGVVEVRPQTAKLNAALCGHREGETK